MKLSKYCCGLLLSAVFVFFATAQSSNPQYDPALAKKLGADEYGMKNYVFVILKTGANKTTDRTFIDSCFVGHMQNIHRLVEDGRLVLAGSFGKNDKTFRGIFILNAKSFDEANELLQTDPAIKEKLLDVELYDWYGSAALGESLHVYDRIWKKKP